MGFAGVWLLLALHAQARPGLGSEFAADLVTGGAPGGAVLRGRLYVGTGKERIDLPAPDGTHPEPSALIVDLVRGWAYLLFPARRTYQAVGDWGRGALARDGLAWLEPVDPVQPCAGRGRSVTCRPVRDNGVAGLREGEWEVTDAAGREAVRLWIDDRLRFPIRIRSSSEVSELEHITVGPQPASLFEVPGDYRRTGR